MRYRILRKFAIGTGPGKEFIPDTEVDGKDLPKDRMESAVRNGWAEEIPDPERAPKAKK